MYDLLSAGTLTSGFGKRSAASTNGIGSTNHHGIDIVLKNNSVPAVVGGMVVANDYNSARGNYVTIQSYDGYSQTYQHLARKSPLAIGTKVTEGTTIGTQGKTGHSTGVHLHFEVKSGSGVYVDPMSYLSGDVSGGGAVTGSVDGHDRPIKKSASSFSLKDIILNLLGKIITLIAVLLVIIVGVILFMKAFDIKIKR